MVMFMEILEVQSASRGRQFVFLYSFFRPVPADLVVFGENVGVISEDSGSIPVRATNELIFFNYVSFCSRK